MRGRRSDVGCSDDVERESVRLWGEYWPTIIDAEAVWELGAPFRMRSVQLSGKNYQQGGPVVYVDPRDESEVRSKGLLKNRAEVEAGPRVTTSAERELSAAFAMLWNKAVGTPDYDKAEWHAFRTMLVERGVIR